MKTTVLHALVTLAILVVFNWMIVQKQGLVDRGTSVLLRLAPVDPRSLMQGDYMTLRYEIAAKVPGGSEHRDQLVLKLDERGVGDFVRLHRGEPLAAGERLLNFRRHNEQPRLGAESFFFQEGTAQRYEQARYGELKVTPEGGSVLIGLRDEQLVPLGKVPVAK